MSEEKNNQSMTTPVGTPEPAPVQSVSPSTPSVSSSFPEAVPLTDASELDRDFVPSVPSAFETSLAPTTSYPVGKSNVIARYRRNSKWIVFAALFLLIPLAAGAYGLMSRSNQPITVEEGDSSTLTITNTPGEQRNNYTLNVNGNLKVQQLTTLNTLQVTGDANFAGIITSQTINTENLNVGGRVVVAGDIQAGSFSGNGAGLTGVNAATLNGYTAEQILSLIDETVANGLSGVDEVLEAYALLEGNNIFTGNNIFSSDTMFNGVNTYTAAQIFNGTTAFNDNMTVQGNISGESAAFAGSVSAQQFTQDGHFVCDSSGNCLVGGGGSIEDIAFVQGGNNFGATSVLGNQDNYDLIFITNNTTRLTISQSGDVIVAGALTANTFSGNGGGLNNLNASNLGSGTVPDARLSTNIALRDQPNTFTGVNNFLNVANTFVGDGAGLINVDAALLGGQSSSFFRNAANLNAGTLDDLRLSSNVTLQGNTFNGNSELVQLNASGALPALDGSNLSNVNAALLQGYAASYFTDASNLSSGTLDDARLSANIPLKNADNTFTGASNVFVGLSATSILQNGNQVCDTSGNCLGSGGGGGISGSGTPGAFPIFDSAYSLTDSIISQASTTITVAGTLSAVALQGDGSLITDIDADNITAGTVSVERGGTGVGTFTANGLLYGNGTGAIQVTNAGSTGQCLVGSTGGAPMWMNCVEAADGSNPGGAAGGDLGGTYPNPVVTGLNGTALAVSSLAADDFLLFDGVNWVNMGVSGDITITGGVATISDGVVTNANLVNSALNVNAGTGLTGGGSIALGGSASLSVVYGATAGTAVEGNTTLICPTGTGNLAGGGDVITLGSGGTCSNLDVIATPAFTSLTLTNALGVGSGGTGADTAAGARTNLGAAASGANNDITSLSAVTSVGGTGALTLQGNASTTINATDNGFTTSVGFANPTANISYFFADAVAGTYEICTSIGNCAGAGGGVTDDGGTVNTIAMFTGTGTIGNSLLSQSGTTVTVAGTLVATALQGSGADVTNLNGTNIDSGTVGVSVGGTGVGSFTSNGIVFGNGTGALQVTVAGTTGECLVGATGSSPTWMNCALAAAGATPGGAAGGDLGGSYPSPTVVGIYGTPLSVNSLTAGDIFVFDGTNWINAAVSGDITVDGAGVATIANGAVTNAKLANSDVTVSAGIGLTGGGSVSLGATTTLNVAFGSTSGTSVAGNTTLICTAGTGNLLGGGNTITLGDGGTCGSLSVSDDPSFNSLTLANALSIANGGTGATSAGAARTNLGAAASGANSDITSITGLTTALNAGQGGTGVDGSAAANGQLLIGNGSGYTLANIAQGSGISITNGAGSISIAVDSTVCTTAGNCSGVNGGVTTSGGTVGAIPVFTAGQVIEDSIMTQSGSVITVAGTLAATSLQGDGSLITGLNASNLASGTVASARISGDYTGITAVGVLTGGSIGTGFGTISTTNAISTTAALQGNTLSIGSGAFTVDAAGAITAASGISSSGAIVFSSLNAAGIVRTDSNGELSTSAVLLGTDTSGSYVANLGTLTGLTATGNSGAGSTPTLSVTYGSGLNTAAEGSTLLSFSGTGNLTGSVNGTAGGGFTSNTLNVVSNPTFSGLVTANGGLNASNVAFSGSLTQTGNGTITLGSLGEGIMQTDANGVVTSGTLDRNSANLTGETSVANGGTGATTASGARSNLGAAARGANSDITSLSGLTTALSAAQGGSGVDGSTAANGTLLIGNGSGYTLANLTQGSGISITNGTGSITIEVDNTVCTTSGNCTAVAGAVSTSGGTTGTIALFTGTQTIGDSILSQSGSVISVAGTLTATALQGDGSGITGLNASNLASGTVASARISGSYTGITAVGALTGGSIGTGFGTIATANDISTSAALQGNTLSIGSGAFAVNASGAITTATGISSSGAIVFSSLNSSGVVRADVNGELSTGSSIMLGLETSGSYVANIGTLTGLTTTGNSGEGSTPTLSVTYGVAANTAAEGNTAISFSGNGNLTGSVSGTAGGGFTTNTLTVVSNPTFSGLVTANGGLTSTDVTFSGNLTQNGGGTITFGSFGDGIVQSDSSGELSSGTLSRNSSLLTGQTSVANGGTGATTASGARTNLGAAASGANNDITSLGAVTSVGGSGALTLQGNASTVLNATDSGFTTSVGFAAPTANITYLFADAVAGTYDICTTSGNCAGVGGSVTGIGTTDTIAMFTGTGTIGNSLLSQSGTTVTVAGTLTATALQGSGASITNLNGTNITSGTVGISVGGTGRTSFTADGIVYGNGTGALGVTAAGVSGDCLVANTGGAPTWANCSVSGGGGTPGGAAGGDLSGTYPNPQVVGLYGTPLTLSTLTAGDILVFDGTDWINAAVSGDLSVDGAGVATIANGAVTNAKLANSDVTVTAGTGLTGGGSVSLGGSTSLSVAYGATSTKAVRGDTTLICPTGIGNLGGGGNTITLGAGGTCNDLTVSDDPAFNSLTLTTALSIANGGTGATSASAARTNLGAAARGSNSDITSLSGLTTALSAGQGGTGVNGGSAANGSLLIGNGSGYTLANLTQGSGISITNGSGSITIEVDNTVCTTAGNCSTVAGAVTTSGGTVNTIAMFTGTQTVGDSILSQSGSVISVAGTLSATTLQGAGSGITNLNASNLASGTVASARISGSYTGITGVGALTAGSIGTGFGAISTSNNISTSAALQGNTLSIGSGAFAVNSTGAITAATGITSSGSINFSSLNAVGVVKTDANGQLSTSAVLLGTETTGSFVASLGTLTGLTTTGNSGEGSTPTLSVTYGAITNTAAQGNTALSFTGAGNLTGSVSGTAGGGFSMNTLNVVSNPTFSGLVTANGGLTASNVTASGTVTFTSFGSGIVQSDGAGELSSGTLSRNSSLLTGQTSVANGGTNATTASGARTNLGAAASGSNSDITSLNGLTTALSAGQGGTGINGASAANGTLLIGNGSGYSLANLTQGSGISITNGSGSITIEVDNTVCTTAGNCSTVAGAVTTSGGTTNTIAMFTGTQTVGDSILTQSGTVISVAGTLSATTLQGAGSGITNLNASNLASGTVANGRLSGSYTGVTGVGALTAGSIGSGFGSINTANNISTSALLQGNTLSIASGAFAVNSTGAITAATGITSSGAINFSSLNAVGVVKTDSSGNLSTSAVILGVDTSGSFVANLGSLTGLTTTGNSGAGSTPTLSVTYGAAANTAAQGNTVLSFTGSGNLTGGVGGTSGGGFSANTLAIVNNPTFSGLVTASGGLAATNISASSTVTFSSLGAGIVQTDGSGVVSSSSISRNSTLLTGQTSVANGGTGATTAAGARTNLGAAASGANSDITSLNSVTSLSNSGGALAVGNTGQALTLQGNASTVISATANGFVTSVGFVAPTANVNYRFATAAAGTYDICTTGGNCSSVAGGVTTAGGTTNTIAMFTGSQSVGNSILSQSGTTVTVAGTLAATALQGSGASITNLNGTNIASGTVGVSVGGTGRGTFTTNGVIYGNGTGGLNVTVAGASGQCLVGNTGSAPTWISCATASTGANPGGAAGGDLSGSYPNPTVVGLYGTALSITSLTNGNIMTYNGTNWVNASNISLSGNAAFGGTLAVTGNTTLTTLGTSGAVTFGSTLAVTGAATFGSTLTATGNITTGGLLIEKSVTFTPTSVGWYRVVLSGGARAGGMVRVYGGYDNSFTDVELQYNIGGYGTDGSIQQTRFSSYNGGVISQARVSSDGGNSVYLDLYVYTATAPAPITLYGFGPGMPSFVSSPVVGATAGSTNVRILTFGHGFRTTNGATFAETSGSVGIGTASPNWKLDVQGGDLNVSGSVLTGGSTRITSTGLLQNVTYNGNTIGLSYGGTGATTAAGARSNLGAAASGANSDITSITGLTTALSVSQGGTGINGASAANGRLLIGNGSGYTLANLTQGTGINITNGAGSITIGVDNTVCTTGGNCSGVGGGVTTPGGTTNRIAMFTGAQTLGDSVLSQSGTTITVNGSLSVTGATTLASVGVTGAANVGSLTVTGNATIGNQNTISLTRTLPTVINQEVDLGTFALTNGGGSLQVSVTVPSSAFSAAKEYIIPVSYAATSGTWQVVQPISDSGPYAANNFALDINISAANASLRLRRIAGTNTGTAYVTIVKQGVASDVFTPSTSTASVAAPTVTYGAANLTQVGGNTSTTGTLTASSTASSVFGNGTNGQIQIGNGTLSKISGGAFNFDASLNATELLTGGTSRISSTGVLQNVTYNGNTIGIGYGGTGSTTASGARVNLGAAASGSNSDITSLNALTSINNAGSLSIGNTGQSMLLQGNASTTLTATSGSFTTTVGFATPTANVTYRFVGAAAGTYDICTTGGNCAGVGGGVTTPGGTANTIAMFTGTGTIANSVLTQSGTTINIGGSLATGGTVRLDNSGNLSNIGNLTYSGTLATTAIGNIVPFELRGNGNNNYTPSYLRIGSNSVFTSSGRGLTLTIVNRSNYSVVSTTTYDTLVSSSAADSMAAAMNAMTTSQIGIITSSDAWESAVSTNLKNAFIRLGLTKAYAISNSGQIRFPYSAVFSSANGAAATTKVSEIAFSNDVNVPPADVRGWFIDGDFVATNTVANSVTNATGTGSALFADYNGNIGIATIATGTYKLNVGGSANATTLYQNGQQVCDTSNNCGYSTGSGGAGYIQNGTTPQSANYNITGTAVIGSTLTVGNEIIGTSSTLNQFRAIGGTYGTMFRQDGSDFYLLTTNSGNPYGNWNSLRPLTVNNATGSVSLANGALWALQSTGRVGIGTSSPTAALDVRSASNSTNAYFINNQAWTGTQYGLQVDGYTNLGGLRINGVDGQRSIYSTSGELGFGANNQDVSFSTDSAGSTRMVVIKAGTGNVGIGLTSPQQNLSVAGNTIGLGVVSAGSTGVISTYTDGPTGSLTMDMVRWGGTWSWRHGSSGGYVNQLVLDNSNALNQYNTAGTTIMNLLSPSGNSYITGGSLGIGTTSPGQRLDVQGGNINTSGALMTGGVTRIDSVGNVTANTVRLNDFYTATIGPIAYTGAATVDLGYFRSGSIVEVKIRGGGNCTDSASSHTIGVLGWGQGTYVARQEVAEVCNELNTVFYARDDPGHAGFVYLYAQTSTSGNSDSKNVTFQISSTLTFSNAAIAHTGFTAVPVSLHVAKSGNVGIGTTIPGYKLSVTGSANATTLYQNGQQVCDTSNNCGYASGSGSGSYIQNGTAPQSANFNVTGNGTVGGLLTANTLAVSNGSDSFTVVYSGGGAGQLQAIGWASGWNLNQMAANKNLYINRDAPSTSNLYLGRAGNELFVRGSDGNVGIGTASPGVKLQVAGVGGFSTGFNGMGNTYTNRGLSGGGVEIGYDTTNSIGNLVSVNESIAWSAMNYHAASHNFAINGSGTATMRITSGGLVGVGPTAPVEKFQVSGGRVYASGNGTSSGYALDNWAMYQGGSTFNLTYNNASRLSVDNLGNMTVIGEVTYGSMRYGTSQFNGTDITDTNVPRKITFNLPAGGYSPSRYFKIARIKVLGNYQGGHLNGYVVSGDHTGREQRAELDLNIAAFTNPGNPEVNYSKTGNNTDYVVVYKIQDPAGTNTSYYDVYVRQYWVNAGYGELTMTTYGGAITVWQAGQDNGSTTPTGTLVTPSRGFNFDTTGNIGIGTVTPTNTLEVVSGINVASGAQISAKASASSPYGAAIRVDSTAIAGGRNWMMFSTGGTAGEGQGKYVIQDSTAGQNRLVIDSAGNVGIGTNSPLGRFNVQGNTFLNDKHGQGIGSALDLAIGDSDTGLHNVGDGALEIYANGAARLQVRTSYINSTVPLYVGGAQRLDTSGNLTNIGSISASGALTLSGGGQAINLTGANSYVSINGGVAPPSTGTRSTGTRMVLYAQVNSTDTDYAFGINGGTLWSSVPSTAQQFTWYGGTSVAATLLGNGNLTTSGSMQGTRLISTVGTGTAPLTVSSTTKVTNLNVDYLDGYDSVDISINRGFLGNTDMNTVTTAGTYQTGATYTNFPAGAYQYGVLIVSVGGSTPMSQTYYAHNGQSYFRMKYNANDWTAWQRVWTDGNDGAGSGLDADTLDGYDSSAFASASGGNNNYIQNTTSAQSANFNITGSGTIGGPLTVNGASTFNGAIVIADNVAAGTPLLRVGDDTFFSDIDTANTLGLYGFSNSAVGGLRLGSGGATLFGNGGNLGIGTTAPRNGLEVANQDSSTQTSLRIGGIYAGNTAVAMGAETSRNQIIFSSWRDAAPNTVGAKIAAINKNVYQVNNALVQNTDLAFYVLNTTPSSADNTVEAMRILSNGNVGIGTSAPGDKLSVQGSGYFSSNVSIGGTFYGAGTGLTGTAAGLSIGGNAGTVTNGVYTSGTQTITGPKYFQSNQGSGVYSGSTNNSALQAYSNDGGTAMMSFHRGGAYAVNFGLDPDNVLRIGGWSAGANRWQLDMSGNQTIAGSYSGVNANLSGTLGVTGVATLSSTLAVNGTGNSTIAGNLVSTQVGVGNVGAYDATKTQAVWAMGSAYTLPAGGGTTSYANHYGLGWSYEPNYGGAGNNPQSKPGLSHQLLIQMAGVTQTAIGTGIWTNGTLTAPTGNFSGVVTASQFNGSGAGLTGTAGSLSIGGNAATATTAINLSTNRTNWGSNGTISAVVGQLGWKNYGNGHTIFDASQGTAPDGSSRNNANAEIYWSSTYPTLMGWNGANTYGVRVDSSRSADNANLLDGLDSTAFAAASGSASYIQNGTSPQSANFNITGSGTIGGNLTVNGHTTLNTVIAYGYESRGVGGDSGMTGTRSYQWGYQEGGAWNHPYPDLIIGYHTGMKLGGNSGYGGTRFYNDHPSQSSTELFSVGNGDNNVRVAYNMYVNGRLGVGNASPSALLHVQGTALASTSGNGAHGTDGLRAFALNGQATTGTTGQAAGNGGSIVIQAGDGGSAPTGGNAGWGGEVTINAGANGSGPNSWGGNVIINSHNPWTTSLQVHSGAWLHQTLSVLGATTLSSTLSVSSNATVGGTLSVGSSISFNNYLWGNGKLAISTHDGWLRLNDSNHFGSGVYTPGSILAAGNLTSYGNIAASGTISNGGNMFYMGAGNRRVLHDINDSVLRLNWYADYNTMTFLASTMVMTSTLTDNNNRFETNLLSGATTWGVCHSGNNSNATASDRELVVCNGSASDYAEMYPAEIGVEAAEIVATTPNMLTYTAGGADPETGQVTSLGTRQISILKKAKIGDNAIGFVSTAPNRVIGFDIPVEANRKPIAMNGRVPVKVNNEGGAIEAGDMIALSTVPGVAAKAYVTGKTFGVALESFNGTTGVIMVYVQNGYYTPPMFDFLQANSVETDDLQVNGSASIGANLNVSGNTTLTNLTVTGSATFLGTLEVKGLLKVADIEVGGHIITAGDAPVVALNGAFDTDNVIVDVVGNDTSGTITITANGGALFNDPNWASNVDMTNGVSLASISFNKQFSAKPRIMLSSANSNAARMGAFTGGEANDKFEIFANNLPANHSTYTFTYWAAQ